MKILATTCLIVALALALTPMASASEIAVGYISFDVTNPGSSAEFDITNLTGPNSSGDATWPISTSVNLSSLSLMVTFAGGATVTEPSTYFTLDPLDGLSWNGGPIGIGGVSPLPTAATLTGDFAPTTVTLYDGSMETIVSTFSATISPSSPPDLGDGDYAIIYATVGSSGGGGGGGVPEPSTWLLSGTMLIFLCFLSASRSRRAAGVLRRLQGLTKAAAPLALVAVCALLIPSAHAAVKQSTSTTPSSGTTGTDVNVSVTSGWPAGDVTPANITVTWSTSCGGTVAATDAASSLKVLLPGSERVDVTIPASLSTATYFVQVSDAAAGDTDFVSTGCSEVQVAATSKTLEACVPASSLGVVAPLTPAPVYAYVPNGAWCCGSTGFEIVQVETGGGPAVAPVAKATAGTVNSCAGNPATGEAVCVDNGTTVYHVSSVAAGNTVTTLTSGSNGDSSFSGGECSDCGVAVNSATNQAVITMGFTPSTSDSALQVLNLATNTFAAPFAMDEEVSENIVVDLPDSAVLSADEDGFFEIVSFDGKGNLTTEYSNSYDIGELDSTAVDCTTRIAIAPAEFTNSLELADLSQATYVAGPPATWSAPSTDVTIIGSYSAGLCGSAVAPGNQHLGVVTGEFGGSSFAVLKLPAAGGKGGAAPVLADYAYVPCVVGMTAGYDPHTMTAYVSPNNSKSYGLFSNWTTSPPNLLQADLAGILALPRAGDGHTVNGDVGASGCLDPAGAVGGTVLANIASH